MSDIRLQTTIEEAAKYERMQRAAAELPQMLHRQEMEQTRERAAAAAESFTKRLDDDLVLFNNAKNQSDEELKTILADLTGWIERRQQLNRYSQNIRRIALQLGNALMTQQYPEPPRPDEVRVRNDEARGLGEQALIDRSPLKNTTLLYLKSTQWEKQPAPEILTALCQLTGDVVLRQREPSVHNIVGANGRATVEADWR